MTKLRATNNGATKSTWPPARGYISISAATPTSYASCSTLSLFFHAEEAEEGARSDHTYRSRPPPSTPSLQFPRHLCTSLCLQLHNNKALNLCRGVNPSLRKESKRQRKEVKGEREKEDEGWGGDEWGGVYEEGEVRKSESEMPWNLITERVVSGRGGEQIKLA